MLRILLPSLALLAASPVLATPRLPPQIRSDLGLSYTPNCSLCHLRGNTGSGTQVTPFALSARSLGLSGDTRGLSTVLAAMKTKGIDSDGDGVGDIQELINGTDPNVYDATGYSTQTDPTYGCASSGVGATLALVGLFALWTRRRSAKV